MKLQNISFILFFCISITSILSTNHNPLLAVLLMVKDEEQIMQKTLQPYIDAGIDSYLILDTGSTDKTIEVTQQLFKKNNIQHGHIIEQPFVDFATSRNYAIEQAEKLLPDTTFFLMIDAEWYISDAPALLNFCNDQKSSNEATFLNLIHVKHKNVYFHTIRLFRPHHNITFQGVVHEMIPVTSHTKTPDSICFTYDPSDYGKRKTKQRFMRDKKLLLQEHQKDPLNSQTMFFLAQTYGNLKDFDNAYLWYQKVCELKHDTSGHYLAQYRCGQLCEHRKDWYAAYEHYYKAHCLATNRAEPLVALANIYFRLHNNKTAFDLALTASKRPYPQDTLVFVEDTCYSFTRFYVLATIAYSVGKYEVAKEAAIKALEQDPNNTQLKKIITICSNK